MSTTSMMAHHEPIFSIRQWSLATGGLHMSKIKMIAYIVSLTDCYRVDFAQNVFFFRYVNVVNHEEYVVHWNCL